MAAPTEQTKRDGVLAMLRSAGEAGVSAKEFLAAGFPCARVHIESLTFEPGLAIESRAGLVPASDGGCRSSEQRFYLVRDEPPEEAVSVPIFTEPELVAEAALDRLCLGDPDATAERIGEFLTALTRQALDRLREGLAARAGLLEALREPYGGPK